MLSLCGCTDTRSYSPVPATASAAAPPLPALELLAVQQGSGRPVHLALTPRGLALVKQRTSSGLHSLRLGNPSSTSSCIIPYRYILAATTTHPQPATGDPLSTLSLSALVPSSTRDPDSPSPLRLYRLDATVHDVGGSHDPSDHAARRSAADDWCAELERRAYDGVERTRTFHCVVNPHGGKAKAKTVWLDAVKPIFDAAGCSYDVSYTGPPGSPSHAHSLGLSHDPASYDALVALSGDGIVHELLNGLAAQPARPARALRDSPIVHVPCGSGNALATSVYGPARATDVRYAALCALKGSPLPLDLSSFSQPDPGPGPGPAQQQQPPRRRYTFLTQAFGLMADLDLGTEHLRWMGDARFTLGYVRGALARRRYPCRVDVRGPRADKARIARTHNALLERGEGARAAGAAAGGGGGARGVDGAAEAGAGAGAQAGDEMPPLVFGGVDAPLPEGRRRFDKLPRDGALPGLDTEDDGGAARHSEDEWVTLDLEEQGVFFAYGGKTPFVSKDVMLFPAADPNDGLIDLVLVAPMSPLAALTAMDNASTGGLLSLPSVTYLKCTAYRLSFPPPAPGAKDGFISVDGERAPYAPFQVECHRGVARVMGFDGRWGGRTRIEGFDDDGGKAT